jgi:hypothetical protein
MTRKYYYPHRANVGGNAWAHANEKAMSMKRKQKKPVRNPKPIQQGAGPVQNKRVNNEPLKPARTHMFERTREHAQDFPDMDPLESPRALDSLLDADGPEDVHEFDS